MNLNQYKLKRNQRLFLLVSSLAQGLGIWLSGPENVHWLLLLIPAMFFGAALNGYCTMLIIIEMIFGSDAPRPESNQAGVQSRPR